MNPRLVLSTVEILHDTSVLLVNRVIVRVIKKSLVK